MQEEREVRLHSSGDRESERQRALFFSHDRRGLGHLRRTLLLCEGVISHFPNIAVLMVTGSQMSHAYRIPKGLDYVKLPTIRRRADGEYESPSLDIPYPDLLKLREGLLMEVVRDYKPDVVFIDTPPLATSGELMKVLRFVRRNRPKTNVILNLRDILEDARVVVPLWRSRQVYKVLDEFYDRICVYGDPEIYNLPTEYEFPTSILRKTSFCGYIPRLVDRAAVRSLRKRLCPGNEGLILVTVGGGGDGAFLISSYLKAVPLFNPERKLKSVILAGPELSVLEYQYLSTLSRNTPGTILLEFAEDALAYMDAADLIVSMAGYNTMNEIAALGKHAIVVPRAGWSSEQRIRAQRFSEHGLVSFLEPEEVTVEMLAKNIDHRFSCGGGSRGRLQCTGIEKLAVVLQDLMPSLVRTAG